MMKGMIGIIVCFVFAAGLLTVAAGSYAAEKSPLFQEVKKIFHASDEFPKSPEVKKTPSHFLELLSKAFYGPRDEKTGK